MPLRASLGGLLPHMGAACTEHKTPIAEKRRPTHSVFSVFCGTPVEVRCCILGDNALRATDVLLVERVVDVDGAYFRRGDEYKTCSLGRRHASPGFPCRFATPHGAECSGGEIPTARTRRPTHSVFPANCGTQDEVRSCILGNNVQRSSDVLFAKLGVGVDSGYFRRGDEQKARR